MLSLKRAFQLTILFIMGLMVAACGSTSTSGYGATGGTTPTTVPNSSASTLKTASVTVNGKSATILTNAQGMTLYYFTADTTTTSACTGGCTGTWPPLLFTGTGSPTIATSLPGTFTVVTDANGKQVEYNGHQLYNYSGDTAPGQTNGEGIGGKWFAATTTLSAPAAPQSTPTSNGY